MVLAGLGLIVLGGAMAAYFWNRQSQEAAQLSDFSAVPAKVQYAAPVLALSDLSGAHRQLSDYRGQVVLVNLWATWCPPCQAEMPLFQKYFERYQASGFTIVAVEDGEPAADVRSFVAKYQLTFPVWLDPTHQATDHAFNTIGLPTSYVLDRSGQVRLTWVGAISEENLEKYVTPLIQER
jgi:peroxiredoxin